MKIKKEYGMKEDLCDLIHVTCRLLIKKKDIPRLEQYCKDIKLKEEECSKCKKLTPRAECATYSFCCYCLTET